MTPPRSYHADRANCDPNEALARDFRRYLIEKSIDDDVPINVPLDSMWVYQFDHAFDFTNYLRGFLNSNSTLMSDRNINPFNPANIDNLDSSLTWINYVYSPE